MSHFVAESVLTATPPNPEAAHTSATARRHDLDWLRIIAILLLLFFHCGMPFVAEWTWHIKNAQTSSIFQEWMFFLSRWRMGLLFFISGVGTYFVMRKSSAGDYIYRRFLRLFIPLVFGMLVVVPPQIYMERLAQGLTYSSYLEFYATVFQLKPYPDGNTSWHHLWFIAYLFIYSIIATPVFVWFRSAEGKAAVARLAQKLSAPKLYLLGVPLAAVYAGLIVRFPGPQNLLNDWAMFSYYLLFFVYGYVFSLDARFWERVEQSRQLTLKLAIICIVVIDYLRWNDLEPEFRYSITHSLYRALLAFNAWFWLLALLGYAKRYLNINNSLLAYANEGIYPFYILHQTVIVIIAFYVVQTTDSILMKFIFLSSVSFLLTIALYQFLVRPYGPMRFLFGMKARDKATAR